MKDNNKNTNSLNKVFLNDESMWNMFDFYTCILAEKLVDFDVYSDIFQERSGCRKNSPFEFMFRGFVGGMFVASLVDLPRNENFIESFKNVEI